MIIGYSEKQVKFLGFVPDEDINNLYSGAILFVFPSKFFFMERISDADFESF